MRHLRIAGYGILDSCEELTTSGYEAVLPAFEDADVRDAFESNPDLQVGLGLVGGFAVDPLYDRTAR